MRRLGGRGLAATAAAVVTVACATNPATGRRELMLVSEGQEVALGRQASRDVAQSIGLYPDAELESYVQELGRRLAAAGERPDLPWSFQVVDDPVVNAFALPGGFLYVTRGILAHFESEAELAGVLGHEIGHVTARHAASQMSKAQLATLGVGVGAMLEPRLLDYQDLVETGLGLLFLKYGRDDEREADDLGLRYMGRAGYDQGQMAGVFAMLERASAAEGGERLPSWLSTHPSPAERRERVERELGEGDERPGRVERAAYLRRLDGLVYGDDPRQGYFDGAAFLHPGMRFRFDFPGGDWKMVNRRDAVTGVSPGQDALVRLSLAGDRTPTQAMERFLAQGGVRAERPRRTRVGGFDAVATYFEAQGEGGMVAGRVIYLDQGGRVFQLLGYAPAARFRSWDRALGASLESFRPLTDRRALEVEPARLAVVTLDRDMTLEEFARRFPSSVSLDELALLNRVEPGARLGRGELVKRVVGGPER